MATITFFLGCEKAPVIPPSNEIIWAGHTTVFFGDSITYGVQASSNSNRWTTLFSGFANTIEDNHGVNSMILQNGVTPGCTPVFDKTNIPQFDDSYGALFISIGVNDVGINNGINTPEDFETTYLDVLHYAINTKGWLQKHIVLLTPYYVTSHNIYFYYNYCGTSSEADETRHQAYVNKVLGLTSTYPDIKIINIYQTMKDEPLIATYIVADGVHPNDGGHAFIANSVKDYFNL